MDVAINTGKLYPRTPFDCTKSDSVSIQSCSRPEGWQRAYCCLSHMLSYNRHSQNSLTLHPVAVQTAATTCNLKPGSSQPCLPYLKVLKCFSLRIVWRLLGSLINITTHLLFNDSQIQFGLYKHFKTHVPTNSNDLIYFKSLEENQSRILSTAYTWGSVN